MHAAVALNAAGSCNSYAAESRVARGPTERFVQANTPRMISGGRGKIRFHAVLLLASFDLRRLILSPDPEAPLHTTTTE